MKKKDQWDALFQRASQEVEQWRGTHKKATLTEIENTVDAELARLRAQMIEDLALASEVADLNGLAQQNAEHHYGLVFY